MPDELWNEARDIVQETGIKTIPKKKKCKKAKWLSEEVLQIALKRREVKGKGKKERYTTHLNTEFQRIARRDKKDFLSDQCKEIEGKNAWERLDIFSSNYSYILLILQDHINYKKPHYLVGLNFKLQGLQTL